MSNTNRWTTIAAAALVSVYAASAIADDPKNTARNAYEVGREEFDKGKYQDASTELMRSWSLVPMPDTALWAARANEKQGRLVVAAKMYRDAIALAPNDSWPTKPEHRQAQMQAQQDAQKELSALLPRIPTLTIGVTGGDPAQRDVAVNGTRISPENLTRPQELDPGTYTVIVTPNGERPLSKTVTLAEGERKAVAFELAQLPTTAKPPGVGNAVNTVTSMAVVTPLGGHVAPPPPKPNNASTTLRTIGWVGIGVGAAGLAVGATSAIVALTIRDKANCNSDNECDQYDKYNSIFNGWRYTSTAGFIVGGVGVATAVVSWFVLKPKSQEATQISMTLGPGSVGMHGVF